MSDDCCHITVIRRLILFKGYWPEARGYVFYSPLASHKGNKSHNHELKADKQLIFTLARIPQGMQKYVDEKCRIFVPGV